MKKTIAIVGFALLTAATANAQVVLGYTAATSQTTYTPLEGATVVFDGATTDIDDWSFNRGVVSPQGMESSWGATEGFEIGFEVNYCGTAYSNFLIGPMGYIYLGNGEIDFNPMMGNNFLSYGSDFNTVGLAPDEQVGFHSATEISYKSISDGADSRLIVQYKNVGTADRCYSSQLVVYPDGKIEVVFGGLTGTGDDLSLDFRIGVRELGNLLSLAGTAEEISLKFGSVGTVALDGTTPTGTTFTFNTPAKCVAPAAQPTELKLTAKSDQISGSFTASEDADTYLVVYTASDAAVMPEAPADGTVYAKNDKLGQGTVTYYGPATDFSLNNLTGGTEYTFYVYATAAYGLDGPVYCTAAPLSGTVTTLPAKAQKVEVTAATLNSLTFNIESNEAGDDIVVLYNTYCERVNTGNHGLFATPGADVKVGDVIAVPEDFVPNAQFGSPVPENAGTVAYIGKAGEVVLEGLDASTQYYVGIFTRNAAGEYTTLPLYDDYSTNLEMPYAGDFSNFPCYRMPGGWTTVPEGTPNTVGYQIAQMYNVPEGQQIVQFFSSMSRGDATNGMESWMNTPSIEITERHTVVSFEYNVQVGLSRFSTVPYDEWGDDDVMQIRISDDNGESWTVVAEYTAAAHPEQGELSKYLTISADLNDYRGKTVLAQYYRKTYLTPGFGMKTYVNRVTLNQADFPAVPELSVSKITEKSATIGWISQQTDYQLVYKAVGGNVTHTVEVEGANTYDLTGLEANTTYEVLVRGIIAGEELAYTEWSDPLQFTTTDYPEIDAPEDLSSDVDTFATLGYVQLKWGKVAEAESYEVAYRLASSTEWAYINCSEPSLLLTELTGGETYIWKVRAFCTHDRETAYSAQARFTAPLTSGVSDVALDAVAVVAGAGTLTVSGAQGYAVTVYTTTGVKVAAVAAAAEAETFRLANGVYVVTVGNTTHKVVVR